MHRSIPAPDAALLDIDLPGAMNGVEPRLELRRQPPHIGIVLLSHHVLPRLLVSHLPV
ncbi:MAG: response regulator [Chloroflexota bacterium]